MYINALLTKNYDAGGTIAQNTIVKFDSSDETVVAAAAETDLIIGVVDIANTDAGNSVVSGDPVDVIRVGIGQVKLAGTVVRGDYVTANASGLGIPVTRAMLQTAPVNVLGKAEVSGVTGDIIPVSVEPQKLSDNAVAGVTYTIGAEATDVINVGLQLTDSNGGNLAVATSVMAYLSDNADGSSLIATAHSGGVAVGTNGLAIPLITAKAFNLVSEAAGTVDLDLTEAGVKTAYLVVVMPNGTLKISGAITHA